MQRITATNWMKTILCFLAFSLSCQICQATIICDNGEYSFQGDICDKNITIDGNVVLYVHGNMDCVTIVCNGSLSLFVEGDFIGDIIAEYLYANIFGGFAGRIDCINGEVDCRAFYGPYPQGDCQIYARDECEYIDDEYGGWGSYGGDEIHIAEEGTATANNYTWTYSLHNGLAEITSISPRPTGALTIPSALDGKTVTSIRGWIFSDCRDLTHVTIPSTVTSIPVSAFNGCTGLTAIEVSAGNSIYESVSGFLLSKDGGTLEFVPGGLTSVEIPGGVTSIGDWSFYSCSYGGLTDVTIPAGIMDIGMYAFYGCNMLKSIIIPSSVTDIKYAAFADCTNACSFVFMGPPPNVASSAFKNVKRGATGTFLTEFKVEWEAVVDENGYWNGLIMHELPPPKITAELADWSSGSITLRCEDADTGVASHKYSLEYLDENNTWVAVGGEGAANVAAAADGFAHLTDGGFCSRLDGIQPVSYRVKDENGRVSEPCVTRNRFLLSVGYSDFLTKNRPKRGHYNDADEIKSLCVKRGGFLSQNAHFRSNADATTEKVRGEMSYFATQTRPGDIFVFYIATHGGDYDSKRNAILATYDGGYQVNNLLEDIRHFPSGVAVINIIMSCHSFALTGGVNINERINQWLVACGFGQCLGNVAWVTSCDAQQSSYTFLDEDHSRFGESFIVNGFVHGCADLKIYGTEYGGGNVDGFLTVGELSRYSKVFFKGLSDDMPSSVQTENDGLLDSIVLGRRTGSPSWIRPEEPTGVAASQGDTKIDISWTASGNATSYRIYRYPLDSPDEFKWIGISGGSSFPDETATLKKEYGYRIKAVNPVGMSDFSSAAIGSRGTSKFIEFLDSFFGITTASADEYDAMEKTPAANRCRTVGECYALGINPEDPNDDFRIANFEMKDGKPVITLNHTEDGSGNSFATRIRTLGAKELGAAAQWDDVTDLQDYGAEQGYRFFKVDVELP